MLKSHNNNDFGECMRTGTQRDSIQEFDNYVKWSVKCVSDTCNQNVSR